MPPNVPVTDRLMADQPSALSRSAALRVEDLVVATASGHLILDSLSLSVAPGEVLALVGESGCGKTSLGLALMGFARPGMRLGGGRVLLGEVDVLQLDDARLRRFRGREIAYVPQDPTASLDPRKRIRSQISEMLEEHSDPTRTRSVRQITDSLLADVGLPASEGYGDRYPFELSGGQQQRVTIAMALACRPKFVVLDEPTTGLDVTTQRRILDLLGDLARTKGAGFIYITHDLAVVYDLADRVAVMYAGEIVEIGGKRALFGTPLHPYTTMLLHSAPRLDMEGRPQSIPGSAPAVGQRPAGCSFAPRCGLATDACRVEPALRETGGGRFVRCHHFDRAESVIRRNVRAYGKEAIVSEIAPLLKVESLHASHGRGRKRRQVVDAISFELPQGECLALVGESGSGKTTIGRCIAGLHVPDAGRMSYRGQPFSFVLEERPEMVRRGIQMVFQNPDRCLNPVRNIRSTLARSIRIAQRYAEIWNGDVAATLLDRVGLSRKALERFPRELSGGERQRVAIAAALALQPTVLICDEVTSALDVSVQASIVELLHQLRVDGLALLFITHNLALVPSTADRIIVLQTGQVKEDGYVSKVLFNPAHSYTQSLIVDLPKIGTALDANRCKELRK